MEKGILLVLGIAIVGFVGYEIIKREKPEMIKRAKASLSDATEGFRGALKDAKASFMEGYASA